MSSTQRLWMITACILFGACAACAVSQADETRHGQPPEQECLDAAAFARVVSWDPRRCVGATAGRDKEFVAEDVFLETDVLPDKQGCYEIPSINNQQGCIGLQWLQRRRLRRLSLVFSDASAVASEEPARLEYWDGRTLWQGSFKQVSGVIRADGQRWSWTAPDEAIVTRKIRWIVPRSSSRMRVERLSALTTSNMRSSQLHVELDGHDADSAVRLETVNCWFNDGGKRKKQLTWRPAEPLMLTTVHPDLTDGGNVPSDRPVIRFRFADKAASAVGLDDVFHRGPVYVPHVGLFVTSLPYKYTLASYRQHIAKKKTILDQVRGMPDQTREQAMARTFIPKRTFRTPIMLSLACGNDKFICHRNGTIQFVRDFTGKRRPLSPTYTFMPTFGSSQVLRHSQGWGRIGINRAAHTDPYRALKLRINEKAYKAGLGHHANGEIVVYLGGDYARFEAEVGLQWQGGDTPGSSVFEIELDGVKHFHSGIMREWDDPAPVSISLQDAQTLTLRMRDAGDGIGYDAGNWAQARLIPRERNAQAVYLSELFDVKREIKRHLAGNWLPAPITTVGVDNLEYQQRTYVVAANEPHNPATPDWYYDRAVCTAEFLIENPRPQLRIARLSFSITPGNIDSRSIRFDTQDKRTYIYLDDDLLGMMDHADAAGAQIVTLANHVLFSARMPAGATARLRVYLPTWRARLNEQAKLTSGDDGFARFEDYWQRIMNRAAQIELPDRWLTNIIRANQVHVMLAARNEDRGARIVPWIAADRYVHAIDSEGNSVIRGMYCLGHFDFTRRALAWYFSRYNRDGFMTTGYTMLGNGWHLWAVGEFMKLSRDTDWFTSVVSKPASLCRWSTAQRAKTMKRDAAGCKRPEYGLMPPGVLADWEAYAYYFYLNSYYYAGLKAIGQALRSIGHPDADGVRAAADDLRKEIRRAFDYVQSRTPVVPLRNGTWVPYYPSSVHTPGLIGDFYPGEDVNRSWCYDVELGAHHMVPLGVIEPDEPVVEWMVNHMEDVHFLADGWGAYPTSQSQEDWFNLGGFARVQPYYARNTEIYAMRDDVKPFVRSYFNTLASLLNGEVWSINEHFSNVVYNKTHETGYFLHQSRTMLATERGDELWLAPLVTDRWFEDGMSIKVANLPTFFGPVAYKIRSAVNAGRIDVQISPPSRAPPRAIIVRLRHPAARDISAVDADPEVPLTFEDNVITLPKLSTPVNLTVRY